MGSFGPYNLQSVARAQALTARTITSDADVEPCRPKIDASKTGTPTTGRASSCHSARQSASVPFGRPPILQLPRITESKLEDGMVFRVSGDSSKLPTTSVVHGLGGSSRESGKNPGSSLRSRRLISNILSGIACTFHHTLHFLYLIPDISDTIFIVDAKNCITTVRSCGQA